MKILFRFFYLKWYHQLLIALGIIASIFALYKLLSSILPFIVGGLILLGVFTGGEIFSVMWNRYKQSKQVPVIPLYNNFYHWLTEVGVSELPIATLQFIQGVESTNIAQGIFYVHLEKSVSKEILEDFEMKARQAVKIMSNGTVDCVASIAKRSPFLAIKIRLVAANEMLVQNQHPEEDF